MHYITFLSALLVLITAVGAAGSSYSIKADSVLKHVSILADDSLEGRQVGEIGEWKAAQYIKRVFESGGLAPAGTDNGYFQTFDFVKSIEPGPANRLAVNGVELKIGEEFVPLRQSASAPFRFDEVVFVDYGITVADDDGDYDDYDGKDVQGKAVVVKRFAPKAEADPHVNFEPYTPLVDKINNAIDHEAAGVFFFTPEDRDDTLGAVLPAHVRPKDIPVIFLRREGLERLGLELSVPEIATAYGETEMVKVRDTGYNVLGMVSGASDTVAIVGSHYDHLGWGGPLSLYRGAEPQVHNGADDNGS
ncbi:MAG: M28 family peptidase, partial [Candidatus Zixiibacteriota bacterium]